MRTSELKKAALDWAVGQATGFDNGDWLPDYSTDWAAGGPIIEREKIGVWFSDSVIDAETDEVVRGETWYAETFEGEHGVTGQTALIAAMRCYVASKLGNEVQIPEELNP
jgi:hypothetical protein